MSAKTQSCSRCGETRPEMFSPKGTYCRPCTKASTLGYRKRLAERAELKPPRLPNRETMAAVERTIQRYSDHGPPPADPLERVVWANGMIATAMWHTATDASLHEVLRRNELRGLTRDLVRTVPDVRRKAAEDLIRADAAAMEGASQQEELTDAPDSAGQAVRSATRRGRPSVGSKIH